MAFSLPDSPGLFAQVALILLLSGLAQGVTGFGFGMISMALLPFLMSVKAATPLVAIVAFVNSISILFQVRHSLDLRKARGLLLGNLLGVPVGVYLLTQCNEEIVRKILGAILILAALQGRLLKEAGGRPMAPVWGPILGFVGGAVGGAFNIGGAPIILYVYRQNWSKETVIAILQTIFFVSLLYRLTLYMVSGLTSGTFVLHCLALTPAALVGSAVGVRVQRRIDVSRLKLVVDVMLILMGALLFR